MTSNDHSTALAEGALLQGGKYRIERVLGQGGFGITYLGTQVALRRQVAIKEFFMQDCCERDGSTSAVSVASTGLRETVARFRDKFVREAQLIAGLDHPHIIRIHDIFEEHGTAYYVMEHIAGGSLSDLVSRSGHLDEPTALGYIRQIGDALSYLHGQSILHLDIKPSNVLLKPGTGAVLIDFGISKHYDETGGQTSTTPPGISKGYAPLEQYRQGGTSQFSPATDVYSLGATLYKLLTGQTPPESMDLNDDGLPTVPLSALGVTAATQATIVRAMESKKKQRYQSVQEMMAALPETVDLQDTSSDDTTVDATVINSLATTPITPSPKPVQPARLSLNCGSPTAGLYVDGERKGTGHWTGEISPGPHSAEARLEGHATIRQTLTAREGHTVCHDFPALRPTAPTRKSTTGLLIATACALAVLCVVLLLRDRDPDPIIPATLSLACETSDALLYVDGQVKGTGSWTGEVTAGTHQLEARKDGYVIATHSLNVREGYREQYAFPALSVATTAESSVASTTAVIAKEQHEEVVPPIPEAPPISEIQTSAENDSKVEETIVQFSEETIYEIVDEMPEFPGGMSALMQFLAKNIVYPQAAFESSAQGRVIVQFVVNKDGSIVDPVVIRSVDPYLDKEALRVVSLMPKWNPGKQGGETVRVKYTVPIVFRLQ